MLFCVYRNWMYLLPTWTSSDWELLVLEGPPLPHSQHRPAELTARLHCPIQHHLRSLQLPLCIVIQTMRRKYQLPVVLAMMERSWLAILLNHCKYFRSHHFNLNIILNIYFFFKYINRPSAEMGISPLVKESNIFETVFRYEWPYSCNVSCSIQLLVLPTDPCLLLLMRMQPMRGLWSWSGWVLSSSICYKLYYPS